MFVRSRSEKTRIAGGGVDGGLIVSGATAGLEEVELI